LLTRLVSSIARSGLLIVTMALAGCSTFRDGNERVVKTGSVSAATRSQMASLDMDPRSPMLIRIFKQESVLEVWKEDRSGRYKLLRSYPICRYSGALGPKVAEGDHQAPEGFYDVTPDQLNPFSHEYLAFNVGFPNAYDRSLGRTGSFLMVHGGCRSVGCYAMTDEQMEEIYGLVYQAFQNGQASVPLEAFPFRMTSENVMQHASDVNAPFWSMLKTGNDHFMRAGRPPRVDVCGQRYVFNVRPVPGGLDPLAPCPPEAGAAIEGEAPSRRS
jgi:murein L,D-transpeptidase YafK